MIASKQAIVQSPSCDPNIDIVLNKVSQWKLRLPCGVEIFLAVEFDRLTSIMNHREPEDVNRSAAVVSALLHWMV